jgi:hypothetical protein
VPSQRLLDQVQSLAAIDGFEPHAYVDALSGELPAELDARDGALAAALAQLEVLAQRVMRIRLDHVLAADTSIAPPTRKVFATTVVGYAADLGKLAARVRDVAARTRGTDADRVAELVVDAARATLAQRETVRAGVLGLARELAVAAGPDADRRARDRQLDEPQRKRWSATRRELELVAADPARITTAPWSARIAQHPEQLDEPAAEPALTIADLLELD